MGKHVGRLGPTWQVCNQGRSGPHSLCVRPAYLLEYRWTQTANGILTCSTRVFYKCVSVVLIRSEDQTVRRFCQVHAYQENLQTHNTYHTHVDLPHQIWCHQQTAPRHNTHHHNPPPATKYISAIKPDLDVTYTCCIALCHSTSQASCTAACFSQH
jgi:hypothetical protein